MAEYKREDAAKAVQAIQNGKIAPIYLVFGDRFLGGQLADDLIHSLIPDSQQLKQNLKLIDGDKELPLQTLNILKTYSLFPGRQVVKVVDSQLLFSKKTGKPLWLKASKAAEEKDFVRAGRYLQGLIRLGQMQIVEATDLTGLSEAKWKNNFAFVKPKDDMAWVKEALKALEDGDNEKPDPSVNDDSEVYMETFAAGIPENNILILLSEEVDKRKRFYKFIKKQGVVLDLSVAGGSSQMAKNDQEKVLRELVARTMAEFGKKIESRALPIFFERVGFYPVAVVREAEKLALYADDVNLVTLQDVNAIVGRTREDALFELTEAYSENKVTEALKIMARMLDTGIHPLVIVSGLRNHLRKLLLVCSFREQSYPAFVEGMSFAAFQKGYLVQLQAAKEEQLKALPTHPYALFMMFNNAKKHSVNQIMQGLKKLLEAEYRLKSSQLSGRLVLDNFILETLARQ